MNKNLKLFMVAAFAIITITGCKKDNTEEPGVEKSCKLTSIESFYNGTLDYKGILTYDASGRISSVADGSYLSTIAYETGKVTMTSNNRVYVLSLTDGRITRSQRTGSPDYATFTYNADGYLAARQSYNGSTLEQSSAFTYTNGNLTKVVSTSSSGINTTLYEFSSELANKNFHFNTPLFDSVDDAMFGDYGLTSKNVMVKSTTTNNYQGSGTSSFVDTYAYTKDAAGNVNTGIISHISNASGTPTTSVTKETYTYTCN